MDIIGPTFGAELVAAGLGGLQISWGADGRIDYGASITPAQRIAIEAVLTAHNPAAVSPDQDAVRDAYVMAKAAVQALAVDASVPAVARTAVVRVGQCLEELLIYLNRRIA